MRRYSVTRDLGRTRTHERAWHRTIERAISPKRIWTVEVPHDVVRRLQLPSRLAMCIPRRAAAAQSAESALLSTVASTVSAAAR
jgi:hypothetical protein